MYYIIGLGNPGVKYINTRHNAGFLFLNYLNKKFINNKKYEQYSYRYVEGELFNVPVRLVEPQTYMNLSGKVIYDLQDDFSDFNKFLVVYDDIDLPLGRVRIRKKGSSGGHNGVKSIINVYESQEFLRIRIGINNQKDSVSSVSDYVLKTFTDKELEILYEVFEHIEEGLKFILEGEIQKAMSLCNGIEITNEDSK